MERGLLCLIDQRRELPEEVAGIVRAGRGLGMVLHAEDGPVLVAQALDGVVVEIDVRDLDVRRAALAASTAKPWFCAVMATLPLRRSLTGWLPPRWPNFSLKVFPPNAVAENLVAEADGEDRLLADELPHLRRGCNRAPRDRRGRWRGRRRRASARAHPRPCVVAGTTCTSKPSCRRRRRMLRLMPKS